MDLARDIDTQNRNVWLFFNDRKKFLLKIGKVSSLANVRASVFESSDCIMDEQILNFFQGSKLLIARLKLEFREYKNFLDLLMSY